MTVPGRAFGGLSARPQALEVGCGPEGLTLTPWEGPSRLWPWATLDPKSLSRSGNLLVFRRGGESLQVPAEGFEAEVKAHWPRADLFHSPIHTWTSTPKRFAFTLVASATLLVVTFVFGVPAAGDALAAALPDAWARQAGASLKDELTAHVRVDEKGSRLLQKFWDDLRLPTVPTQVHWVDDGHTVNAFALMGGQVLVYEGIVKECRSADELAGVLAHEAGHGQLKHSARMIGRSLAGAFLLGYLLGDPTGLTGAVLGNVDSLRQMQFSREMEAQADDWAADALSGRADVRALGDLLGRIDHATPQGWEVFLASHPATGDRQASWNRRPAAGMVPAQGELVEDFEAIREYVEGR